ncbi:hypothetical protein TPY_3719 [Sulfobacillus acidophilus TPY]|uniref:Uncharacterized protein n=1 Tax=Sulfobacillus acidophilus (strain ATCC 700253 / DSM 10332 / NAL) TaxID=679936 RepID=G8TTU7_SULAD|nr:hypothetical protein TPY_3719 [Sulfobacillus acidophilus TPY]AEW06856.1 hypothetical protein Sulac_3414 [Sulfobacillus acidophilus DSM 10332]
MSLAVIDVGFAPSSPSTWTLPNDFELPQSIILEFPVTPTAREPLLTAITQNPATDCPGLIRLTIKELTGLSTMVKNLPVAYKGVLGAAYVKAAETRTQPWHWVLLARFKPNAGSHAGDQFHEWFHTVIQPILSKGHPDAPETWMYIGRFATIAAGDRQRVYTTAEDLARFVQEPPLDNHQVTVLNHVLVRERERSPFNHSVTNLLTTAQITFQPTDDPSGLGQPGASDNTYYRKPLSTEILMGLDSTHQRIPYLMHGIWESLWDHENSHVDTRFRQAAGQLAPYIVGGPEEPFYRTILEWAPGHAPAVIHAGTSSH